ncbi:GEVED domain-containing protein [Flavobacterium sp. HXWNR69]|uniref:GEVED domain-containing protein n=2 Tax=Flavobacterium TaxID=237 RepID=A0ABT0TGK1_9FLAO|nr:GEVED domain-containing protein [Flavobacterium sp. HXWNR69]MCL9769953.1 GEVED domain-containing protein [Flavobacterium sp. HXWNR69]
MKKLYFLTLLISSISFAQYSEFNWDTNGITVAGGNGAGSNTNQLNFPYSVIVDANNNLYITDTQNHRIQKWTSGETEGVTVAGGNGAGANANQLNTPTCVWVDENQNIYVMDSFNNRIQKWDAGATSGTTVAGGNGEGAALNQFNKPGGFYFRNNAFYIVDAGNNRIIKWILGETSGTQVAAGTYGSAADQLANPTVNGTIYVDANENLYVTDYVNNRVQKFAPGNINATTVAGGNSSGTNPNQLRAPNGIFMLPNGRMMISEYTGRRINMWVEGESEGTVVAGGNGNGSASNQFRSPRGNFISANGDLYVTDMANHRIQKFTKIPFTPVCNNNLGGGLEPSFVTFKINGTTFEHNTYTEPTEYYHAYPQTTTLEAGQAYDIYTFTSSEAVIGLWMDYNQNNIFEDTEFTQLVNNMNSQNTTSFTVSSTSNSGLVKMRIRSRAYGSAINSSNACTSFGSGETRDYIFTVNNSLGVNDNSFDTKIKVYPNPTSDYINIESLSEIKKVTVYNMMGQMVLNTISNKVDISNLSSGTFILEVTSIDGQKSKRKIIKK